MSTDERAAYVEGLRVLAAALEAHPEIPLLWPGTNGSPLNIPFYGEDARGQMAAAVRALPCSFTKSTSRDGKWLNLNGKLGGGLHIEVYAARDTVCTRRVVGIEDREVEEEVQPAVTRKVTKPIEIIEWDCGPVLGAALDKPAPETGGDAA